MATAGRRPKPHGMKVLEGDTGKRSKAYKERFENEKVVEGEFPVNDPPSWLTAKAREEWIRLAGPLVKADVLKITDLAMFASYCQAYGEKAELEEALVKNNPGGGGLLCEDKDGKLMLNPLVKYMQARNQELFKLSGEFGLTPATRARLSALSSAASMKEEDPMDALLNRRPG